MGTSIGLSRREHAQANPMSIVPVAIFILYTQPLTGKTNSNNTFFVHKCLPRATIHECKQYHKHGEDILQLREKTQKWIASLLNAFRAHGVHTRSHC
jgi:hypothetical protein